MVHSLLTLSNLLTFLGLTNFWPILFTFPHVDYLPLYQITLERGLCLAKALRTQNYFSRIHTSLQSLLTCPSLSPKDRDKGTSHKDSLHFLPSKHGLNKDREGSEAGSKTLSKSWGCGRLCTSPKKHQPTPRSDKFGATAASFVSCLEVQRARNSPRHSIYGMKAKKTWTMG